MSVNNWFEESRRQVAKVFGCDADLFCKLLAGTSPISTIESNVAEAIKAYRQIKWFGYLIRETFIFSRFSCLQKLLMEQTTTRKVAAMYQNMRGNEQVVAVDRWLLRYFGWSEKAVARGIWNDSVYSELEDKVKQEAAERGITPAQRQLQIWCATRGDDTSYGDIIRRRELHRENILGRLL